MLWMCGLPGLTPDKMIDVDFEAIEEDPEGVVRIDNADFLARPVRLGSSEASALIVALRALREGSTTSSHEVIDRCLVKLEEAAATGTAPPQVEVHLARLGRRPEARRRPRGGHQRQPAGPAGLLRPDPRRDHAPHRRPARAAHRRGARLPGRLVPPRRGTAAVPAGPDACRGAGRRAAPGACLTPRDLSEGLFEPGPEDVVAVVHLERYTRWVADYYPVDVGRGARRGPTRGDPARGRPPLAGPAGPAAGPRGHRGGAARSARGGRPHRSGRRWRCTTPTERTVGCRCSDPPLHAVAA